MPSTDGFSPDHEFVIQYLANHDVRCEGCGYNLRGLQKPNCPECGNRVSLRLYEEHTINVWLIAMIGSCLACGPLIVMFIVMGIAFLLEPDDTAGYFLLLLFPAVLALMLLSALYLRRRTFWRKRRSTQRLLAAMAIIGMLFISFTPVLLVMLFSIRMH